MERSKTPLEKWLHSIYFFIHSKNSISAVELSNQIGVTYKTAWKILNTIRKSLDNKLYLKLAGKFEVDETYIGGRKRAKGKNKLGFNGMETKHKVFGIFQKESNTVRAFVVNGTTNKDLLPIIKDNIMIGSTIHSDEYIVYRNLPKLGYKHGVIKHKDYKFSRNGITTNRIESFWSYFKNPIRSTQKHISKKWLQSYLDEFMFRYNNSKRTDLERFDLLLNKILKLN
jgi:transposase-like protein